MPRGWSATQRRILRRDGNRCRYCGGEATEVHHTQPGLEVDAYLVAVCHGCHNIATQAQARAAAAEARARTR